MWDLFPQCHCYDVGSPSKLHKRTRRKLNSEAENGRMATLSMQEYLPSTHLLHTITISSILYMSGLSPFSLKKKEKKKKQTSRPS